MDIPSVITVLIPIFTSQLEKARESTDAANLRSAYAEVSADALLNDGSSSKEIKVNQSQTKSDWQSEVNLPKDFDIKKGPKDGASADYWTVKWDSTSKKVIAEAK